jgi:hypothetical protein
MVLIFNDIAHYRPDTQTAIKKGGHWYDFLVRQLNSFICDSPGNG